MVLRALCCSCLLGAATAQAPLILPPSHAAAEGTTSTNVPFGRSTPTRVQYAYDPIVFAGPVVITEIALRLDGGAGAGGKVVDCEIRLSTMPLSLVQMSVDFASNRGADETIVLPRQLLTLPAAAAGGTPGAFQPPIVLTTPFAYDPAAGALLIEIVVFGQPPGSYPLDATYVCTSPEFTIGPLSCSQSNGLLLQIESATTQVIWGRPWVARALDAQPGSLVLFIVGTVESGPVGGLVLPVDLAIVGAPGCMLSIDIAGSWTAIAAGDGTAAFPFVLDNTPTSLGQWIRFQAATLDANANALGVVTSQAKKVQVCGWEPVARVWSSGITSSTGTREIGVAAVVQLTTL